MDVKKYDVDYFIEKFSAIPLNQWTTGTIDREQGKTCALGHCGVTTKDGNFIMTEEAIALASLFAGEETKEPEYVWRVNDIMGGVWGGNPKDRILNKLGEIKQSS